AVLRKFRGKGVGQELVKTVLSDLPEDATYVYMNAQIQAVSLYEKFGFEKTGPEFEEAGIRHYKMEKKGAGLLSFRTEGRGRNLIHLHPNYCTDIAHLQ